MARSGCCGDSGTGTPIAAQGCDTTDVSGLGTPADPLIICTTCDAIQQCNTDSGICVSSDANNAITTGTDGCLFVSPSGFTCNELAPCDATAFGNPVPTVRLAKAAPQLINGNVAVTWDSELYDTDSMWVSGSNVTINTPGIYAIDGGVQFGGGGATSTRQLDIELNGTSIAGNRHDVSEGLGDIGMSVSTQMSLAAGDVIQLVGNAASKEVRVSEQRTHLALTWISPPPA